jgi:HK97 family phage prohead protease
MSEKLFKQMDVVVKSVNTDEATMEAVFSTADQDRHGDIVQQNWDLKNFKKNPVILNSHTYFDATEVVGKAEKIKVIDGALQGKIKFAVAENPKAKIIFDLYAGGFLNAFSVGFIPKEWSDKGEILKSELLEISTVSVPANAYALAKAKGIDVNKLYEHISDNKDEEDDGVAEVGEGGDGEGDGGVADEGTADEDEGEGEGDKEGGEVADEGEGEVKDEPKLEDAVEEEIEEEEKFKPEPIEEEKEATEEEKALQKQEILRQIAGVVKSLGEAKVETRCESVRAETKRLISQAVRNLLKIKSNI